MYACRCGIRSWTKRGNARRSHVWTEYGDEQVSDCCKSKLSTFECCAQILGPPSEIPSQMYVQNRLGVPWKCMKDPIQETSTCGPGWAGFRLWIQSCLIETVKRSMSEWQARYRRQHSLLVVSWWSREERSLLPAATGQARTTRCRVAQTSIKRRERIDPATVMSPKSITT